MKTSIFQNMQQLIKTTEDKLRLALAITAIALIIMAVEQALAEIGVEKTHSRRSLFVETGVVVLGMVLPALFLRLSKSASKAQKGDEPIKAKDKSEKHDAATQVREAVANAARDGDEARAQQLLQQAIEAKIPLDHMPFNAVILSLARKGAMQKAENILKKMCSSGTPPNAVSYNILMDACVKADDAEAAEVWLDTYLLLGHLFT